MAPLRRLVVDVLKPHDPPLVAFTEHLADLDSVAGASASLVELDQEVQNIELTLEGEDVDFEAVEAAVEELSGTVHSVDEVACGESVVADRPTDRDG